MARQEIKDFLLELGFVPKKIKYWNKIMDGFDHPNFPFPEEFQSEHHGVLIGEERIVYYTLEEGDIEGFIDIEDLHGIIRALESCEYPINQCITEEERKKIIPNTSTPAPEIKKQEQNLSDIKRPFALVSTYFGLIDALNNSAEEDKEEIQSLLDLQHDNVRSAINDIEIFLKK
jgi:hypothetical protein